AAGEGFEQIVKLLVDKCANLSAATELRGTAIHVASRGGHAHVIKLLLDSGVDPDFQSRNSGSAMYLASEQGHTEVVKLLIDSGANKEAESVDKFLVKMLLFLRTVCSAHPL
ncbi:ankyrin, partial [Phaeosphaeriaceae sp. SRC1lsM3a]